MVRMAENPPRETKLDELIEEIEALCRDIRQQAEKHQATVRELPPERQQSARNLLHYLALRSHDLRPLQDRLAHLALSSIGRSEPHVLATLDSVLYDLHVLAGRKEPGNRDVALYAAFAELEDRLEQNTVRLLGDHPTQRRAHIMVTVPAAAADDYLMVHQLLKSGMDCMRINCAHDDPETWSRMIEQMRHAQRVTRRACGILMDLRGPKLRTGRMKPEPGVLKIRPRRNAYGEIERPARIWLTAGPLPDAASCAADACLSVDPDWLARCRGGDKVRVRDARQAKRRWRIREVSDEGCLAESRKTTYLMNGTRLQLRGSGAETEIRGLADREGHIVLRQDDVLLISAKDELGVRAVHDDDGALLSPGRISLPIPEIYRDARPGEPVSFDDGRISGIIEKCDDKRLQVRITHTRKAAEKLRSDKGVNLPDTRLDLPALSAEDLADLDFVGAHADMIGLSFCNTADDVRELRERLRELGHDGVGLVVKIETKRGFANLPEILLEALKFPACGVMIARGDLAVECGFERMAELQEEILWLCESAHVPVIWATQVLEGLTKRGHASRAEITDAAMGQAAECVMLNKGPYIGEAVRMLDDILSRMQDHKSKKRSMLRKLHLATEHRVP